MNDAIRESESVSENSAPYEAGAGTSDENESPADGYDPFADTQSTGMDQGFGDSSATSDQSGYSRRIEADDDDEEDEDNEDDEEDEDDEDDDDDDEDDDDSSNAGSGNGSNTSSDRNQSGTDYSSDPDLNRSGNEDSVGAIMLP